MVSGNENTQHVTTSYLNNRNLGNAVEKLPELYSRRENCCGCSACYSACPVNAIQMMPDKEGFLYPAVDADKCVCCYRCLSVCAFKTDQKNRGSLEDKGTEYEDNAGQNEMYDTPISYAVKHKNREIRSSSRSGGVFTALSDAVLEENGVIFGCVLTEEFLAIHVGTENDAGRNQMRGSKYIESDLRDSFKSVKEALKAEKFVLFSGTSCQIAGLKAFLGSKVDEHLLCVDILCHGVPSPLVWKAYLNWLESTNNGRIEAVDFRNKRDYGWKSHFESIYFENAPRLDSQVFKTLFFGHHILRPGCYECPYKDVHHPGDITIADFWGIEKAVPGFSDNQGVSLVLINNDKGKKWFEAVENSLEIQKTELTNSLQPALLEPSSRPKDRKQFWRDFETGDFGMIAERYGDFGLINEWKRTKRQLVRKVLRH